MKKSVLIQSIIDELEKQLELTTKASLDAASYATDEDAKADSKWDTQGLEASYLAAGQAAQAVGIGEAIQDLKQIQLDSEEKKDVVETGSLVECEMNGMNCWFFVSQSGGGMSIFCDDCEVTVITPQSPIAHRIIGKKENTTFTMINESEGYILSVS